MLPCFRPCGTLEQWRGKQRRSNEGKRSPSHALQEAAPGKGRFCGFARHGHTDLCKAHSRLTPGVSPMLARRYPDAITGANLAEGRKHYLPILQVEAAKVQGDEPQEAGGGVRFRFWTGDWVRVRHNWYSTGSKNLLLTRLVLSDYSRHRFSKPVFCHAEVSAYGAGCNGNCEQTRCGERSYKDPKRGD